MELVQVREGLPAACRMASAGARAEDMLREQLYLVSFYGTSSQHCITGTGDNVCLRLWVSSPRREGTRSLVILVVSVTFDGVPCVWLLFSC